MKNDNIFMDQSSEYENLIRCISNINIPKIETALLESTMQAIANINTPKIETALLESMSQAFANINVPKIETALLESTVQAIVNINTPKIETALLENISQAFSNIGIPKIEKSLFENIAQVISKINIHDLHTTVLESYNDYNSKTEDETVSVLQYDEEQEIEDDIKAICTDENWQQSLANSIIKWKVKNPVIAWVLLYIILPIFIGITVNSISSGITSHSTKIKDIPSKNGVVISQIAVNQEITIVNECSYYYEVVIINTDEQEIHGWVAKRNISITNSSSLKNSINE